MIVHGESFPVPSEKPKVRLQCRSGRVSVISSTLLVIKQLQVVQDVDKSSLQLEFYYIDETDGEIETSEGPLVYAV